MPVVDEFFESVKALAVIDMAYARYLFRYTSTLPEAAGRQVVFEGMCQFQFRDGKIARYSEVFDRGTALSQLDFVPERIAKSLKRWADKLLDRSEMTEFDSR